VTPIESISYDAEVHMINIQKNPVKVQLTNRMLRFFPVVLMASASLVAMVKPSQADSLILSPNSQNFSINGINTPNNISGLQQNGIRMPNAATNNLSGSDRMPNMGNSKILTPGLNSIDRIPSNDNPGVANLLFPAAFQPSSTSPQAGAAEEQPRAVSPKTTATPQASPTEDQPRATSPTTSAAPQPRTATPQASPAADQPKAASPQASPAEATPSPTGSAVNSQISVIYTRCYAGAPSTEPEWRNWISADNMDYLFQPDRRKQKECRR
jgi:hypothetical protein